MDAPPPVEAGKPHICVVTETYPPEVNGVALTLARLLNGLQARGHAVPLVRPRRKRGERTDNAADFPVTLVPSLPLPGYDGLHLGLPANRLLRQNWARQRPDAVYVATEGPLGLSAFPCSAAFTPISTATAGTIAWAGCNPSCCATCAGFTTARAAP